MGTSRHFGTENYALRLDIVQNLCEFCQFFLCHFLGPKCFDTSKSYTTRRTFQFQKCMKADFEKMVKKHAAAQNFIGRRIILRRRMFFDLCSKILEDAKYIAQISHGKF